MSFSFVANFRVKFLDVEEFYGIDERVSLKYSVSINFVPTAEDWIGLFNVGWFSTKDYLSCQPVIIPETYEPGTHAEFVCTFEGVHPKNEEDFFQFCYIDSNSHLCGASVPFQFIDDYDIVILTESMRILGSTHPPDNGKHETNGTEKSCPEEPTSRLTQLENLTAHTSDMKKQLLEKDLELKRLLSQIGMFETKLKENQEKSVQLEKEVHSLKSELTDEKCKLVSTEKSLQDARNDYQRTLSELNAKEIAYQEKENKSKVTILDLQNDLCHKAQELEIQKIDSSRLMATLDVKQVTIEDLKRRYNNLSAELIKIRKATGKNLKLKTEIKEKETNCQNQAGLLEKILSDEKCQKSKENENSLNEVVTDGPEEQGEATGAMGRSENAVVGENKVEISDSSNSSCVSTYDKGITSDVSSNPDISSNPAVSSNPGVSSDQEIHDRVQPHERMCPMCNEKFDSSVPQNSFELHVNEHLANTIKLSGKVCPVCNKSFPASVEQKVFERHVNDHF